MYGGRISVLQVPPIHTHSTPKHRYRVNKSEEIAGGTGDNAAGGVRPGHSKNDTQSPSPMLIGADLQVQIWTPVHSYT